MVAPKTSPTTFAGTSPPWSLTSLDTNFANFDAAISTAANYSNYLLDTGTANTYVVTFPASIVVTLAPGLQIQFKVTNTNTGVSTLNVNGLGAVSILRPGGSALVAGDLTATAIVTVVYDGTNFQLQSPLALGSLITPPIRQTVLSGNVDTNGLPSFGGSTGSTTVTQTTTLVVTAANGAGAAGQDRIGTITNASWTGLSTNGTMYLYLDVSSSGACTTGSTTLAPVYGWGTSVISNTSGQAAFVIQQMTMYVGSGAAAPQTYRVFVGEVTVAGAVVTAITWYAIMGRYTGPWTNTLPGITTATSANHNIGVLPTTKRLKIECITTDDGYAVGDQLDSNNGITSDNGGQTRVLTLWASRLSEGSITGSSSAFGAPNKSTGTQTALTAANWKYRYEAERGW